VEGDVLPLSLASSSLAKIPIGTDKSLPPSLRPGACSYGCVLFKLVTERGPGRKIHSEGEEIGSSTQMGKQLAMLNGGLPLNAESKSVKQLGHSFLIKVSPSAHCSLEGLMMSRTAKSMLRRTGLYELSSPSNATDGSRSPHGPRSAAQNDLDALAKSGITLPRSRCSRCLKTCAGKRPGYYRSAATRITAHWRCELGMD